MKVTVTSDAWNELGAGPLILQNPAGAGVYLRRATSAPAAGDDPREAGDYHTRERELDIGIPGTWFARVDDTLTSDDAPTSIGVTVMSYADAVGGGA